jgi:beta-lactamase class A
MTTRREFLVALPVSLLTAGVRAPRADAATSVPAQEEFQKKMAEIERASGGRLGVAVLDTASGDWYTHRGNERFPMCSTFKVLAVSAVLARVDAGAERLDRMLPYSAKDLEDYSPITKDHAGAGMSLGGLCAAAMDYSDNTAANLILASIGGPAGVTRFARSLHDPVTRLDRTETALNSATPGDPRDTSSPRAMAQDLRSLALGPVLSAASRDQLVQWMTACTTGNERLRAGVPKEWRVGDKTGSGDHGTANDLGILWPPKRAPWIVAAYLTGSSVPGPQQNAALAAVGRAVASLS